MSRNRIKLNQCILMLLCYENFYDDLYITIVYKV